MAITMVKGKEEVLSVLSNKRAQRPRTLKEALAGKMPEEAIELVPRAFDTVGAIAVIEIPKGLEKYEKTIGRALLSVAPNIVTVVKKVGGHTGTFRRQKMKILAGKRSKTTMHTENGIRLMVHVQDTYFSPRTSTERLRVAGLVKPGENVLVMFSGIGPFPLTIAKNGKSRRIIGIEINPAAHKLAVESLGLNKKISSGVELKCGDVRDVLSGSSENFDRIIMPLPKGASGFLDLALLHSHPGTVLHVYDFSKEEEIDLVGPKLVRICSDIGRKVRALQTVKCGQSGMREYRVCADLEVLD